MGQSNAWVLNKIKHVLPDEKQNFCCSLTSEIMDDPVIDPTTLVVATDPDTLEPYANPHMPTHFKNYLTVPRYERYSLERLIDREGIGRSPTTRLIFTKDQLISDSDLISEIEDYICNELKSHNIRISIRSNLCFSMEKTPYDFNPAEESHILSVSVNNEVFQESYMLIHASTVLFILKNFENIHALINRFSFGVTALSIKKILQSHMTLIYPVVVNLFCQFEPYGIDSHGGYLFRLSLMKNNIRWNKTIIIFESNANAIRDSLSNIEQLENSLTLLRLSSNKDTTVAFIRKFEELIQTETQLTQIQHSASVQGFFDRSSPLGQNGTTNSSSPIALIN